MKNFKKYKEIILLISVLMLFLFSPLFELIPILLFKIDIDTASDNVKYLITLYRQIMLVLVLLILYFKDLKRDFIKFKENFIKILDQGFKYWFIGLVFMAVSNILITLFTPQTMANNETAVRGMLSASPIIVLILTSIIAPFVEEIIFRKAFKDIFKEKWLFIITSGLIFGSLHVISDITSIYNFLYIIPYSSLGISFAYMYYKSDNIFSSISMHFIHNTAVSLLSIFTLGIIVLC